jgi:hypothetical protein
MMVGVDSASGLAAPRVIFTRTLRLPIAGPSLESTTPDPRAGTNGAAGRPRTILFLHAGRVGCLLLPSKEPKAMTAHLLSVVCYWLCKADPSTAPTTTCPRLIGVVAARPNPGEKTSYNGSRLACRALELLYHSAYVATECGTIYHWCEIRVSSVNSRKWYKSHVRDPLYARCVARLCLRGWLCILSHIFDAACVAHLKWVTTAMSSESRAQLPNPSEQGDCYLRHVGIIIRLR